MKHSLEEIFSALQAHEKMIRDFGVKRLSLFGSCARGEATETSDIDFLVDFERKSFDAYMGLKFYLEELLSAKVDLVTADALKERLRNIVLREAIRVPGL